MLQHLMTPQRRLVLWQWILNLQAFSPFLPTPVPSRSCWVRSLNQAPSESTLLRVLRLCVATWTWLHLNSAPNDKLLGFCRICTTWNWPGRHLVSAPPELGAAWVIVESCWLDLATLELSAAQVSATWSQRRLNSAPPTTTHHHFQIISSSRAMHWTFQSVKCIFKVSNGIFKVSNACVKTVRIP